MKNLVGVVTLVFCVRQGPKHRDHTNGSDRKKLKCSTGNVEESPDRHGSDRRFWYSEQLPDQVCSNIVMVRVLLKTVLIM